MREPRLGRERFEQQLRHLVGARAVCVRDEGELGEPAAHLVTVPIPDSPSGKARIEALFEAGRPPDAWARRMLGATAQVAGLLLEIERAHGRWPVRPAAPTAPRRSSARAPRFAMCATVSRRWRPRISGA